MTPPLTAEQLLIIADEFCDSHRVQVRDFGALVAAAAVPGARIAGIPVYTGASASAAALESAVIALRPLTDRNSEFARVSSEVYRRLSS